MGFFGHPCSMPGCRRRTRHASIRCHDHRGVRNARDVYDDGTPLPRPGLSHSPPGSPSSVRSTDKWGETDLYYGEEWTSPAGDLHREDGPAKTEFHSAGREPKSEEWFLDNEHTRIDGPAIVKYHEDGSVRSETYAVRGLYSRTPSGLVESLRELGPECVREEIERSPYAPLQDEGVADEKILAAVADGVRTPDGVREHATGTPAEWIRAWESAA